jgi:hypothetical protein
LGRCFRAISLSCPFPWDDHYRMIQSILILSLRLVSSKRFKLSDLSTWIYSWEVLFYIF